MTLGLPSNLESRINPEPNSGCWLWTGALNRGYGQTPDYKGTRKAHRRVWEHLVGPIPKGRELDHLCRVLCCVNPDHLEPVTTLVNVHRSEAPSAQNARKFYCVEGHPFSGHNLVYRQGKRQCRKCEYRHQKNYLARKRGAQ